MTCRADHENHRYRCCPSIDCAMKGRVQAASITQKAIPDELDMRDRHTEAGYQSPQSGAAPYPREYYAGKYHSKHRRTEDRENKLDILHQILKIESKHRGCRTESDRRQTGDAAYGDVVTCGAARSQMGTIYLFRPNGAERRCVSGEIGDEACQDACDA